MPRRSSSKGRCPVHQTSQKRQHEQHDEHKKEYPPCFPHHGPGQGKTKKGGYQGYQKKQQGQTQHDVLLSAKNLWREAPFSPWGRSGLLTPQRKKRRMARNEPPSH